MGNSRSQDSRAITKYQLLEYTERTLYNRQKGVICLRQTFWVPTPLCYLENAVVAKYLFSGQSDLNNSKTKRGHFLKWNVLSSHSPMLSWKMQFVPHISSPISWIWTILRLKGGPFVWGKHFEYQHPYVILKMQLLPHISSPSSQIWTTSRLKEGHLFETNIVVSLALC